MSSENNKDLYDIQTHLQSVSPYDLIKQRTLLSSFLTQYPSKSVYVFNYPYENPMIFTLSGVSSDHLKSPANYQSSISHECTVELVNSRFRKMQSVYFL